MKAPILLLAGLLALSACTAAPEPPAPSSSAPANSSSAPSAANGDFDVDPASIEAAYDHLDETMDEWGSGEQLRLPSSYRDGHLDDWDTSVIYDDALVAIAYANRDDDQAGQALQRAELFGDVFLSVQANDPIGDGRVRNSYDPSESFDDEAPIASGGAALGNNAWVGLALVHIAQASGRQEHLDGAIRLASWIVEQSWDERGPGGFTGGRDEDDEAIEWKSTEHNIDAAAFFAALYTATGDEQWDEAADHARSFVEQMWDAESGYFHLGTRADGETINDGEYLPSDVQSWANLLLLDEQYQPALDWVIENLEVTDQTNPDVPITGVRFALRTDDHTDHNDDVVWLEGTAQTTLALRCAARQTETAQSYLDNLQLAQTDGPNANGRGLQANSSQGYSGGDDTNYTSLHIGATAWYLMAAQGINPFHVGGSRC